MQTPERTSGVSFWAIRGPVQYRSATPHMTDMNRNTAGITKQIQQSVWRTTRRLCLAASILVTAACSNPQEEVSLPFEHDGQTLAGTLLLPRHPGPHPAVILVHGDGDTPWDGYGYCRPMMHALTTAGFAVFSWDKPGVGASSGNWLTQSMQDRADETISAATMLASRGDIDADRVGLLGFSQAGWVMPRALAAHDGFAFMISVSGAIDWQSQGRYLTRQRMALEGHNADAISRVVAFNSKVSDLLETDAPYSAYQALMSDAPLGHAGAMPPQRWAFAKRNLKSDATPFLSRIAVPVLAVFGARDLNVDVQQSVSIYKEALTGAGNTDVTIKVFPDADHSLLKTDEDRLATGDMGMLWRLLWIDIVGEDAFAPGYIDLVTTWLTARFSEASPAT